MDREALAKAVNQSISDMIELPIKWKLILYNTYLDRMKCT